MITKTTIDNINPDYTYLPTDSAPLEILFVQTHFDIIYCFVIHSQFLTATFISKQDISVGLCIPAEERLMLTLRFLATGASYRDLFYTWKISTAAISYIIMETCKAISTALKPTYVTVPQNSTQWLKIGEKYHNRWNFPNAGSLPLFRQKSVWHPKQ